MTIRIAMTIATMGRFMKNFDMAFDSFALLAIGIQRLLDIVLEWLGLYRHSRPEILLAFDNHAVALLQSAIDDPHCVCSLSHLHGTHADAVVLIDNSNEVAALLFVHCRWWNDEATRLRAADSADLAVLPGAQNIARVWKQGGELDGASVRVHLAI